MSLFTPSGGLVYHARALRFRDGLWAPFRDVLAAWLAQHLAVTEELILVGPSGGHCLPLAHLSRFGRLLVLEPDPLARRILALRLPRSRLEVEHRDLLLQPLLSGGSGLDTVLRQRPRASVLFCNLLGQLHFGLSDDAQVHFRAELRRRIVPLLEGRSWASFHDRWSLDRSSRDEPTPTARSFERQPNDDELGVAWFGPAGAPVTVLDHGTSGLFPEVWPRSYFSWQITPQALHVVEAVSGRFAAG
jgi:hypothetical protein